jgi:Cu/Ag efflux protein CusF
VNADPKLIGVPVRIEGPNLATLRRLSDFSGMHGRSPPQAVAASRSVKSAHTRPYAAGLNCQVVARHQNLEVIMTLAKISLASAAAITIISWGALAQENQNTGRITQFNHINGKITLQHAPAGTVGAVGASSLVDEYKIQDGVASKDLHAGDEVDFTAAQIGGVLTITKIQKK